MEWEPEIRLTGEGLVARPYVGSDTDSLFEAAIESTGEIFPWLPWCHPKYSRGEAEEWTRGCKKRWVAGESYDFALFEGDEGRFLGGCSLNLLQPVNRLANLGYWVRTSATGRGVATASVGLVAGFGFGRLELRRVEIVISTENAASLRVAEKAGALREGVLRNRLSFHGKAHDAVMFSLIDGEIS